MIVLKLGGSLLSVPDLAARIEAVCRQRSSERITIVVGGGAAADVVREWDRAHSLGDEAAHQLALRAMRLSAEFVALRLPAAKIVANTESLAAAWAAGQLPLLAADAWLTRAEQTGRSTVPHTWDATSDSIAAWLAAELSANELVLLKSVDSPVGDLKQAVRDGLVDPCFPAAAARVPHVSWVNLRSESCQVTAWVCVK